MAQRGVFPGGRQMKHGEMLIQGPFRGYDPQDDPYHPGPENVFDDTQNVDFRDGNIVTRPGLHPLGTLAGLTEHYLISEPFPGDVSSYMYGQMMGAQSNPDFATGITAWGEYDVYNIYPYRRYGATYPTGGNKTQIMYHIVGTAPNERATVALGGSTINFVWTGSTDCNTYRMVGAWIKFANAGVWDDDTTWRKITSVSGAGTASIAPATFPATRNDEEALIVWPIIEGIYTGVTADRYNCITSGTCAYVQMNGTNSTIITGGYGGRLVYGNSFISHLYREGETSSTATDLTSSPFYYFGPYTVFGQRGLAGSTRSVTGINGTSYVEHPGRLIWAPSGSLGRFWDSFDGANFFDLDLGEIFDLFVLRGRAYAVHANGITAISQSGNWYAPHRAEIVTTGQQFVPDWKAVNIDGQTAVLMTTRGPVMFDGSRVESSKQFEEAFRSEVPSIQAGNIRHGRTAFDASRRRFFFINNLTDSWVTVNLDNPKGEVTKHIDALSPGQTVKVFAEWWSPTTEAMVFTDTEYFGLDRNRAYDQSYADSVAGPPATTREIPQYAETKWMMPTGDDVMTATVDQVRITFKVRTTSAQNTDVQLFVDGSATAYKTLTFATGAASYTLGETRSVSKPIPMSERKTGRAFKAKIKNGASSGGGAFEWIQVSLRFIGRAEGTTN